jgi:hypothetical protein
MEISDEELRAMVRDAIARQSRGNAPAPPQPALLFTRHVSHGKLSLVTGGDPDGRCLIEPAVACNHCGYCQSLGH